MKTRRAGPRDIDVIRSLTRAAYAKWIPLIGREPKPMVADYVLALKVHRFDLLLQADLVIGLIETVAKADALLIENVAVLPTHQHRGWGRHLLGLAEDIARGQGARRVRLYTNSRFAENIRLYARLGYVVDRHETTSAGVAVHMSKPLLALGEGAEGLDGAGDHGGGAIAVED